jgi:hypothetical protein
LQHFVTIGGVDQKARELAELQEVLKQRDEKLAAAQRAQADLIRKQRELDDAKRGMDLTIEKRMQESLATTRKQATKEAENGLKLKVLEKEQTIASMQKQIEELKRKAEQGSLQLRGEFQELELEDPLRTKFPRDLIEPVPKGEHGDDAQHRVRGPFQQICGTILWESKRTRNWSDGWLAKLREHHRAAKADLAVIVSHTWAEDRAMRGRDPSAGPGAKTGEQGTTPLHGLPGLAQKQQIHSQFLFPVTSFVLQS